MDLPATYRLDLAHRLVWSRGWGQLQNEELAAHSRTLRGDPRFDPSFRQLQDLTAVTAFDLTPAGLQIVAWLNPFGVGARRAVVVPSPLDHLFDSGGGAVRD